MSFPKGTISADEISEAIRHFTRTSRENSLGGDFAEDAWGIPLVGFSRGDDTIYGDFKRHVGPFHWTPSEAFSLAFPESRAEPEELSVISWILPQTEAVRADNRREELYPSERWARSRIFGEKFNVLLRRHVVSVLQAGGCMAVAPSLLPQWKTAVSEEFGAASTWSERHAAYASGLGTFGLSDGLITPAGKAMRTASVVANVRIPPSPRPYTDHREYCLFFSRDACGKCISRCPVQAIDNNGHDKLRCLEHLRTTADYVKTRFGFDGYGCGLCQTGLPCEAGIPGGAARSR